MRSKFYPKPTKLTNLQCPECGCDFGQSAIFETALQDASSSGIGGEVSMYKETPVASPTFEGNVLVPAAQSLVTSIVTLLPSVLVSMYMRWDYYAPLAVGATTLLVSWITSVQSGNKALAVVEQITRTVNGSGNDMIARNEDREPIRMEVLSKDGDYNASIKIVDLPRNLTGREFVEFCRDILAGKSLSRVHWAGSGKAFSREQYDQIIEAMLSSGLIVSMPGQGKRLTLGGRHAIKRLVSERGSDVV